MLSTSAISVITQRFALASDRCFCAIYSAGPKTVVEFTSKFEGISVEIETFHFLEAVNALQSEQTEIAISYQPYPRERMRIIPITTAKFVCVMPKAHWSHGRKQITSKDLAGESVIDLNVGAPLGHLLSSHLESVSDLQQSRRIVANTYLIAKMLVAQGAGIAIGDEYAARCPSAFDVDIHEIAEDIGLSVGAIVREPIICRLWSVPSRTL